MFGILTLAASLLTAAPAAAQEAVPATTETTAPVTTAAPTTAAPTAAPVAQPTLWQSLGNQVIAHDTITSMDTNGDGSVSHDEYMAYQEAQFKALDKNGDSSLSADEVGTSKKKSLTSFW